MGKWCYISLPPYLLASHFRPIISRCCLASCFGRFCGWGTGTKIILPHSNFPAFVASFFHTRETEPAYRYGPHWYQAKMLDLPRCRKRRSIFRYHLATASPLAFPPLVLPQRHLPALCAQFVGTGHQPPHIRLYVAVTTVCVILAAFTYAIYSRLRFSLRQWSLNLSARKVRLRRLRVYLYQTPEVAKFVANPATGSHRVIIRRAIRIVLEHVRWRRPLGPANALVQHPKTWFRCFGCKRVPQDRV
jgi:hypothetical protein